jgi:hypothetical protein
MSVSFHLDSDDVEARIDAAKKNGAAWKAAPSIHLPFYGVQLVGGTGFEPVTPTMSR